MSDNVKIYEIARQLGISSTDLVEICQKSGYDEVTHHSNAVPPEQAEEIRRTAIKKYRPKGATSNRGMGRKKRREKAQKEKEAKKKAAAAEKKKREEQQKKKKKKKAKKKKPKTPSVEEVTPVAPPAPRGKSAPKQGETDKGEGGKKSADKGKKSGRGGRNKGGGEKIKKRTIVFKEAKKPPKKKKEDKIEMTPPVTVRDLSERLGISAADILQSLMFEHNVRATINQSLDEELVQLVGMENDVEITFKQPKTAEERLFEQLPEDDPEDLEPRPPVIAMLGHVDHGKTTILDRIRHTNLVDAEDGGITQDVGAWQINHNGHTLTFVDTPGHEAFTAMRARGAQVTDIVVLVVAADDGVMPQTEEAIDHARAAGVPIVVAVNKIDKPEADPMAVRRQLAAAGLNPEEWGGETGCVDLSALQGEGMEELLERISLEAELLEVQANPDRRAQGVVLEAEMQEGLGVVANVVVQNGTLRKGDPMLCGSAFGRIRTLSNQNGDEVEEAGPSDPVAVSGLSEVPDAGVKFLVVENLDMAREIAEERREEMKTRRVSPRDHVTLENLYERLAQGESRQLNVVLKGDVQGSLEPLVNSLEGLNTDEVNVDILHEGIGNISESDVLLADASDAIIIAFRVGVDDRARELAEQRGVQVRDYRVIYNAVQDVRQALEGMLEPEKKEERLGVAEVRAVFNISRVGTIAGCYVVDGLMKRDARARVRRDGETVYEGRISSLRREENDVKEVERGYECGINVKGFNDVKEGDAIECFQIKEIKRTLS